MIRPFLNTLNISYVLASQGIRVPCQWSAHKLPEAVPGVYSCPLGQKVCTPWTACGLKKCWPVRSKTSISGNVMIFWASACEVKFLGWRPRCQYPKKKGHDPRLHGYPFFFGSRGFSRRASFSYDTKIKDRNKVLIVSEIPCRSPGNFRRVNLQVHLPQKRVTRPLLKPEKPKSCSGIDLAHTHPTCKVRFAKTSEVSRTAGARDPAPHPLKNSALGALCQSQLRFSFI